MQKYGLWTNQWMIKAVLSSLIICGCTGDPTKNQKTDYVSVKTIRADASTHIVGKNYEGTIEEEDGANVSFGVIGNVIKVMAEEGQFVRKDQALAEVDGQNS